MLIFILSAIVGAVGVFMVLGGIWIAMFGGPLFPIYLGGMLVLCAAAGFVIGPRAAQRLDAKPR